MSSVGSLDTIRDLVCIVLGAGTLIYGGDQLVQGAARLARALGVPVAIIALTIVAGGTSMPELVVSVNAALNNSVDVTVGNVIGSNLFNLLPTLGLVALFVPVAATTDFLRREIPILLVISFLTLALCWDLKMSQWEGYLFLLLLVGYLYLSIHLARAARRQRAEAELQITPQETALVSAIEPPRTDTALTEASPTASNAPELVAAVAEQEEVVESAHQEELEEIVGDLDHPGPVWYNLILMAAGFLLMVLGSDYFLYGSVNIARQLGISELVIGLTLIAAGTSAPELATSLIALIRGESDLALGNIVGSCLFNLLAILGLSAAIQALPIAPALYSRDIPLMIAVTLLCWFFAWTSQRVNRWEGALLTSIYVGYLYLILSSPTTS